MAASKLHHHEIWIDLNERRMRMPGPETGKRAPEAWRTTVASGGWDNVGSFQGNRLLHENSTPRDKAAVPTQNGIRVWEAAPNNIHAIRDVSLSDEERVKAPRVPSYEEANAFVHHALAFKRAMNRHVETHRYMQDELSFRPAANSIDFLKEVGHGANKVTLSYRPYWDGRMMVALAGVTDARGNTQRYTMSFGALKEWVENRMEEAMEHTASLVAAAPGMR